MSFCFAGIQVAVDQLKLIFNQARVLLVGLIIDFLSCFHIREVNLVSACHGDNYLGCVRLEEPAMKFALQHVP